MMTEGKEGTRYRVLVVADEEHFESLGRERGVGLRQQRREGLARRAPVATTHAGQDTRLAGGKA